MSGVPVSLEERVSGADSQCALTIKIALGLPNVADQSESCLLQMGSSKSGGAPCPAAAALPAAAAGAGAGRELSGGQSAPGEGEIGGECRTERLCGAGDCRR